MFDLPSVLRGKKPLSELAGLAPMAGWAVCIGVNMGITVLMQNQMRRTTSSLYLRDLRVFFRDLARQVLISFSNVCCQSATSWFRIKITYAWMEKLQGKLHATYFKDDIFYRQTTWPDAIADPGQRITRDIEMLAMELRIFCTSLVAEIMSSAQAMWRVWFLMPKQRYIIAFVVAWSYANLAFRNWFAPALKRGIMMANASKVRGAFRDAHSKLASHAEAIISFNGVAAEARRLDGRLEDSLEISRQMTWEHIKEHFSMSLMGEVISQTITR